MTKELPLSRGRVALVDDADYDNVSQWKWFIVGHGYAGRFERRNGKRTLVYLHRFLLAAQPDERVDHINGERLDARRANLRLVTCSQNQQNRKVSANSLSGCKGVTYHKRLGKWHVRITVNGQRLHLGYYTDLETAALMYDASARHFFSAFSRLNRPENATSPEIAGMLAQVLVARAVVYPKVLEWGTCKGLCALCRDGER